MQLQSTGCAKADTLMDRVSLDRPTEAYVVIKVNLIFIGSGGADETELSRDFLSAQLDSHFYDNSLLDIGSNGESGFKYDFVIHTFHLHSPTQSVLTALQRTIQTNAVKVVRNGHQVNIVSARAMSQTIQRLTTALGLRDEISLVLMDFTAVSHGNMRPYGYHSDTQLTALMARISDDQRVEFAQAQLDALIREKGFGEGQNEGVEEVGSEEVDSGDDGFGFGFGSDQRDEGFESGSSADEVRIQSLAEAWAKDELIDLESKESSLAGYLHLDEFQEVDMNKMKNENASERGDDRDVAFVASSSNERRNALEALQMLLANRTMEECLVNAWIAETRTAWIDLSAGPCLWGRVPEPYGSSVAKVEHRHIIPKLASFLHSLTLKHNAKATREEVYVQDHIAVQLYVVDTHYGYDVLGNRSLSAGFDIHTFRDQLRRFALPGQTFSFVVHHIDMDEDLGLGVAFAAALRSATIPVLNATTNEVEPARFNYVDSKVLEHALKRELHKKEDAGDKLQHKTLVLPVFVFSVDTDVPFFVDEEQHIAKALTDMVVVVQSSIDLFPTGVFCNNKRLSHSLRNPTRKAFAATLELWGALDLAHQDDLTWSVGPSVLSQTNPFSDLVVSDMLVDSFHRATMSRVLASSHSMQRRAYEAIGASKAILEGRKHGIIGELHELEAQLVSCWDRLIEYVQDMKWQPAFALLKPLLRKSRLLLKASLRAAAEARISCDPSDDIEADFERQGPDVEVPVLDHSGLVIAWVVVFAAVFFWSFLFVRRAEKGVSRGNSSPARKHQIREFNNPQQRTSFSRAQPKGGSKVRRRKRVQFN